MTNQPAPSPAQLAKKKPAPGLRPAAQAPAAQPAPNNPAQWGRVEADGTAWVRTGDGERCIGQYKAGSPEEGLAHFGARYDDLSTEVSLLESRLRLHPEDASAIRSQAQEIRSQLDTAKVIGNLDALDTRLAGIITNSDTAQAQVAQEKQRRRAEGIAAKEKLAAEAEEIAANSTEWKAAGDRIHAILEEWKTIQGVDRKTDDKLWKRYSRARDSFNRRRGSHFADLDRARAQAKRSKEELVERARALQDSTDWAETARAFRDLMKEWKTIGRAPRETDDALWEQFRSAQDHFFDARTAANNARDREYADNAAAKDALLEEYRSQINPEENLEAARDKLAELQEKWEQIGYVPRGQVREYEDKIAAVERSVKEAADNKWRRTDPAAQARAAQFQAKVDDFTAQAEQAAAKGDEKRAEQLRAQAAQWAEWANAAAQAVENR
ncbi:DUF349 domain-containing protein [Corynebacterium lowii]|uniref:Uncharacterized protein n=1 Tax=Corynebacterium lowii TaxID=1544413 RepID=A0A0Q0YW20_9CORY|nr:DUF349 domain-containing protein [Corynebacterium lowii]KQB86564.1 hypothetical protein Clow_00772 [Corynebacterium lowii]MDP9851247.1 putative nucleic acid-binding Zn-ribbon protein [Corynebacterium lowii]